MFKNLFKDHAWKTDLLEVYETDVLCRCGKTFPKETADIDHLGSWRCIACTVQHYREMRILLPEDWRQQVRRDGVGGS